MCQHAFGVTVKRLVAHSVLQMSDGLRRGRVQQYVGHCGVGMGKTGRQRRTGQRLRIAHAIDCDRDHGPFQENRTFVGAEIAAICQLIEFQPQLAELRKCMPTTQPAKPEGDVVLRAQIQCLIV